MIKKYNKFNEGISQYLKGPTEEEIWEQIKDLPNMFIEKVIYFYKHYKDLENKNVTIGKILNKEEAYEIYHNSKINLTP